MKCYAWAEDARTHDTCPSEPAVSQLIGHYPALTVRHDSHIPHRLTRIQLVPLENACLKHIGWPDLQLTVQNAAKYFSRAGGSMKRVLFVCMGNICRSPAAEGVFRKMVTDRGLQDRISIDSAGTIGYHSGSPADSRMRRAAAKRGYRLEGLSRQFTDDDFDSFDLIVAMDRDNLDDINSLDPTGAHAHKVKLLSEFLPPASPSDVPDPYYGGDQGFEVVLNMIERACEPLLQQLQSD